MWFSQNEQTLKKKKKSCLGSRQTLHPPICIKSREDQDTFKLARVCVHVKTPLTPPLRPLSLSLSHSISI